MSIVRAPRPTSNFTVVSNDIIHDDRISYRARGILMAILARPDHWRTTADRLATGENVEGRKAVQTAIKELRDAGYLVYRKYQNEKGHWVSESTVFDSPQPKVENGPPVTGVREPSSLVKTESKNSLKTNTSTPDGVMSDSQSEEMDLTASNSSDSDPDSLFAVLVDVFGEPKRKSFYWMVTHELYDLGVSVNETRRRARSCVDQFDTATPMAMMKHWDTL
jgi:hypothetical protein